MRQRRLWAIILAAVMGISAIGCGQTSADSGTLSTEDVADADAATTEDAAETDSEETTEAAAEAEAEASDSVLDHVPAVGDEIHGFTVTALTPYEEKNAVIVSMTHEKSGAELLYIACDDADKSFQVFFRTAADTDQGLPHIFEHGTLGGSGKYPNSSMFFSLANSSYHTYLNASTMTHCTEYQVSSLSDDQLYTYADVYMAGLTDPLVLQDENRLGREAYRYSLASADDDLTVTGAVYNEMESNNSNIVAFSLRNLAKFLYPNSQMSANTGGVRNEIITVTVEDLQTFHDKYYHPSNMLILLYGDLDYDRYLELLDDDYLSKYDRQEITIEDENYVPWTGYREGAVSLPATADASAEDSGWAIYSISLRDISLYDRTLLQVVTQILMTEGSPIRQAVEQAFPGASLDIGIMTELSKEPMLYFILMGSNPGDGSVLHETVQQALEEVAEQGLDEELIQSVVDNQEISNALTAETPGSIGIGDSIGLDWALYGDALSYMESVKATRALAEEAEAGTFDALLAEYVIDPAQSVTLEINPEPGLREEIDEEFAQFLADKKAAMSDEEIAALVQATADYDAWTEQDAEEAAQYVEALSVADLQTLSEEATEAEITEETIADTVTMYSAEIADAPYLSSSIYLDAGVLPFDELQDAALLGSLLGSMATENYTVEELGTAEAAIYSLSFGLSVVRDERSGGQEHPYLLVSSMTKAEDASEMYALLEEILERTDFSDTDRLQAWASMLATNLRTNLLGSPEDTALGVANAAANVNERLNAYTSGIEYLSYLDAVAAMDEDELQNLAARLQDLLAQLCNRNGMIYSAIGSADGIDAGRKEIESLAGALSDEVLEAQDYTADLEAMTYGSSIAVAVNDANSYNGYVIANGEGTWKYNGTDNTIMQTLLTTIWFPQFRYQYGAYGFHANVGRTYTCFNSYRDPDIAQAYAYYDGMADVIRSSEITEADVTNAALSLYSSLSYPQSPLSAATTEIDWQIRGREGTAAEDKVRLMRAIKAVTAEDVVASADRIQDMVADGIRVTAANSASIKENEGLFDQVIDTLVK